MARSNVSVDVINRWLSETNESISSMYPIGANVDEVKAVGKIIVDSPNLQNRFSDWLINRIGKTKVWGSLFSNPWAVFNRGMLEYGDSIEEIFVDICRPYQYSASVGDREVFKRVQPDVKSAFHLVQSEVYYKSSISEKDIRRAFLSLDGVENLVRKVIGVMIESANYDEYLQMKYIIGKAALDGSSAMKKITAITNDSTAKSALKEFRAMCNNFQFMSRAYNAMSVANTTPVERQYLITTTSADAAIGVEALAYMFGPQYAANVEKKLLVDSFSFTEEELQRLRYIYAPKDETTGEPIVDPTSSDIAIFTSDELTALANIEAVLLDEEFFMIYTQLFDTRYITNPQNLYENNWLHVWKMYSRSPFANIMYFHSNTNSVTIAIDDSTLPTVTAGTAGSATIDVDVTLGGLVPKDGNVLKYSVTLGSGATGKASITQNGKLSWDDDFTADDTIIVKVESLIDATSYDTATITVAAAT